MPTTPAPAAASRLDVMNFLNEIAGDNPQALSFASGRPAEAFFGAQEYMQRIPEFVRHLQGRLGGSFDDTFKQLAQYGRTNGIINELISIQTLRDEGVASEAGHVIVTAGCQEAMDLCVTTLCREPDDVLLVRSPTYIGITGVADINGIEIVHFSCAAADSVADALTAAIRGARQRGKRPRALYLVPDFDNPTGTVLSRAEREAIIAISAAEGVVVLEDNPYGMFRYEGTSEPRMASLDAHGCVVYLGTYAKTLCPALRVGFMIVPPTLFGDAAAAKAFIGAVSQAKSFVTVNTSQIAQAVVGGVLLAEDLSLARRIVPAIAFYRHNRDAMVQALQAEFGADAGISWNEPQGGFFLVLSLPFAFGRAEAEICTRDHGVIVMPLSFFALDDGESHRVRLAFSNSDPQRIREGVARLGRFVHGRLRGG
ncbi:PLP-dependent aminotransferase family protein [Ramlibacter sp.]|uniref:aminotransferase-like domain-containing protein n=1 Tax=Ramlibacter sp. TaxID=1917967 RepID=UPI00182185A0|nr:PLP-dependent aminotransferase family protein [Ramlibacter sp.]MBA2675523.1 PLP-dependent aminotransferase family protein [Ramlibacter sp.]